MAIIPPVQHGRPTLSWTIALRVAPGRACVMEAAQLQGLAPGTAVAIEVDHLPDELDPRVAELVRAAWLSRALRIELRGDVGSVHAWWRELQAPPPAPIAPARHRHLSAVRDGGDAE